MTGFVPELPPPPGYSWHNSDEARTSVLVPKGWFTLEEAHEGTAGVFVSRESIAREGAFRTGFTLNYISGFRTKYGMMPAEFAATLAANACAVGAEILMTASSSPATGVTGEIIRYCTPGDDPRIVHQLAIADDPENTFRLVLFEAPEAEWSAAWNIGEAMLKYLCLWRTLPAAAVSTLRH